MIYQVQIDLKFINVVMVGLLASGKYVWLCMQHLSS